jgi:hypothetical protein
MGLFSSKNNTISDRKMASLQRRARKADKEPWTSKKAVARRLRDNEQRRKSIWS